VMFVIAGIMLILGCFMNPSSIMILTIPLFLDLTKTLGFSVFHYGIITQVAVGVGFITPPFGNVLFCMVATFGIKLHTLAKALIPALLLLIFALALIVMFPQITQFVL
jgi:TRAP-type C4-dicarboxylate transport system, large permease component